MNKGLRSTLWHLAPTFWHGISALEARIERAWSFVELRPLGVCWLLCLPLANNSFWIASETSESLGRNGVSPVGLLQEHSDNESLSAQDDAWTVWRGICVKN